MGSDELLFESHFFVKDLYSMLKKKKSHFGSVSLGMGLVGR